MGAAAILLLLQIVRRRRDYPSNYYQYKDFSILDEVQVLVRKFCNQPEKHRVPKRKPLIENGVEYHDPYHMYSLDKDE